jgi:uncharacterized protein DUF6084
MPDLTFAIEGAEPLADAAAPCLSFALRVANRSGEPVDAVLLRCQVQIEAARRRYTAAEKDRLRDLFGEPERWGQTLHPLLWANLSVNVPAFTGAADCPIQVPCTFDFNVAATKYFYGIEAGEIPVSVLFSGTVFYRSGAGLQVQPIPWDREARFALPVRVWREMMDLWYPGTAWLHLGRTAFDALCRFRSEQGIPTFDESVLQLLRAAGREQEVI